MTIAELITQLSRLNPATRVAVWRPSTDKAHNTDIVRLVGGAFVERIVLTAQADPTSDNYPLWEPNEHAHAEATNVVIIS